MHQIHKILMVLFLSLPLYATGQNITISGVVKDMQTEETLPYATILVEGTSIGTSTNVDGFFTLHKVPSDTATLIIRYIGYEPNILQIKPAMMDKTLEIKLKQKTDELEEVVVSAGVADQIMNTSRKISQISVSPEALGSLPSIGEQDIFRAMSLMPGVSGTNEASSGLFVRGGTPDQNLIVFDGFTIYHVDHLYGFFSAFNPNAIKNVNLYKGGFESKYGGRISSVMELTGKTGNNNQFAGNVGVGLISTNGSIEVPVGENFNLLIAGRRSYTDVITSGLFDDIFDIYNESSNQNNQGGLGLRNNQTTPSVFFYDVNAKLSYRPSLKDIVSLSFYNGQDIQDNSRVSSNTFPGTNSQSIQVDSDITDDLNWGNIGSSLRWGRFWSDNFYTNTIISFSNYFSERDRITQTTIDRPDTLTSRTLGTVEDNDLYDYSFKLNNEWRHTSSHTIEFGAELTQNDISYNFTLNDTTDIINQNNNGLLSAFFVQDQWQVINPVTVTGGLRYSLYDVTGESYFEPRISLEYNITDKFTVKGAWGQYNQFVNRIVREDISQGSRDFWLLADDETNPISSAEHFIAGLEYENNEWLFSAEAFEKDMEGLAEFSMRFSNNPTLDDQFFFEGTGVARGIEWLAQKKIGEFKGWITYTLSEVVHDFPEISENQFYALHDSRHEINLVGTYEVGNWQLSGTWVYGTGKPFTSPQGEFTLTMLDGSELEFIDVGPKNAFRLPAYHRMDLSANYNFMWGSADGTIGLSLFNLYDRTNVWFKEFEIVDDNVIETDVTLIGFTPNINLNFNF